MRLFYKYMAQINEARERRFGFEEFSAGTATVIIPENTPAKGTITVPATKRTIQRYVLKDKKTGETLRDATGRPVMRAEIFEDKENLDLAYEITTDPFAGPGIRNYSGSYLQHLKLKGYFDGMPIIPRPPRIRKKDGETEEGFDREKTIVMDGKNMDNTRISVSTIFYFSSEDLQQALKNVEQKDIEPTSKSTQEPPSSQEPPPSTTMPRTTRKSQVPGTIMSPDEIVNWSISKIIKTIEDAIRSTGIEKIISKNDLVAYLDQYGDKKVFKIVPPSQQFIRNKWMNGEWKLLSKNNPPMRFISTQNSKGVSPVTTGILPNLDLIASRVKAMI